MLSLKFVSNSLRSATAVATNQIGSSVVTPSVGNTNRSQNDASQYTTQTQTSLKQTRLFTTNLNPDCGAMSESRAAKINTNAVETDLNLPMKPKKPIIPWVAFVRERKDEVLRQKEKMTAAELAVILAKEWKLTDKSKYEKEYNISREEYLRNLESYEKSLTQEHRDYLDRKKNLAKESKVARELKKTRPPILPRNPANFYCSERCLDENMKEQLRSNSTAVLSNLFKEYRSLSDAEKEKYLMMQKQDKTRFAQEFNEWYENIMHEDSGHSKAVKRQADMMRMRFKGLGYIE